MASTEIISAASHPVFVTRVAFIALKTAQNVASEAGDAANHANRVAYANRIFTGAEVPLRLAMHIVASNGTIAAKLEAGEDVPDGDIEYALATIWDARSNAFAPQLTTE